METKIKSKERVYKKEIYLINKIKKYKIKNKIIKKVFLSE